MNYFYKVKDSINSYVGTPVEQKVIEATSTDPWGCSNTIKNEISRYTMSSTTYSECVDLIWKRLDTDPQSGAIIISKTLDLVSYMLVHASLRFVRDVRNHSRIIAQFRNFNFNDGEKDYSPSIREHANKIQTLLDDEEELNNLRSEAGAATGTTESYGSAPHFNGHSGDSYGGMASTGSSGSKYGGMGSSNNRYGGMHSASANSSYHDSSSNDPFGSNDNDPFAPKVKYPSNTTASKPTVGASSGHSRIGQKKTLGSAVAANKTSSTSNNTIQTSPNDPFTSQQSHTIVSNTPNDDPFANDEGVNNNNNDPFGLDDDNTTQSTTTTTTNDPFASSTSTNNDPFGQSDVPMASSTTTAIDNDPFASMNTLSSSSSNNNNDIFALYNQPASSTPQQQQKPNNDIFALYGQPSNTPAPQQQQFGGFGIPQPQQQQSMGSAYGAPGAINFGAPSAINATPNPYDNASSQQFQFSAPQQQQQTSSASAFDSMFAPAPQQQQQNNDPFAFISTTPAPSQQYHAPAAAKQQTKSSDPFDFL